MMAGLVKRHGGVAFALFDESARLAAEPNPLNRAYWVNDILAAKADEGRIVRADDVAGLAERAGIDASALAGTLERYNADCARGLDTAFFKPPPAACARSRPRPSTPWRFAQPSSPGRVRDCESTQRRR